MRVSVVVVLVRVSAIGAEVEGDDVEGAGVVDVTPGLVVDELGALAAGRSVVLAGRSGFVV